VAGARRPPRLALIALGILLGGWATGYLFATQVVFPASDALASEYLTIPDLRGLTLAEAEALLVQNDLVVLSVDSVHHPDVSAGSIFGQGPLPGQLAIPQDSVRLTLSLGAERRAVPDVAGLIEDRALLMLHASGFTVLVDSLESDLPVGTAISTSPQAGTERAIPSEVRLAISLGPPFILMPDLLGMREEDARAILDAMGLVLGTVEERAQLFNPGEVVEQNPTPGTEIENGGEVSLVISRRRFF
jgi:serine/threonine-protein kinase